MNKKILNNLSDDFLAKLAEISAGYITSDLYDKFVSVLRTEISNHFFTRSSESNLLRIISAMYDKYSFLTDCVKYPHYVEILTAISSNSNYLTDILVRNPEYFYWIVNPSNLEPKPNLQNFEKSVDSSLHLYRSFSAKVNFFRSLKRKEILRIGLRDILSLASLQEITEELSILARVISAKLFEICLEEVQHKHSISHLTSSYCLVALGKLGGNELNYSSDIDLIIFYDEDQELPNKTYHEILTEAIYLFIESASAITSSGFIFRVDFRLRPDGRNSPLCRSLNEYLNYYESRGEDWERQMLIKAGFVGGNIQLFNKFINYLTPFIYPSSFVVSPLEQIRKLKDNIERKLSDDENIKLIPGGIRDIEFTVQALQLLNGGKWKSLRTGNTLSAVHVLSDKQLLSEQEAEKLSSAYKFYRRIEHYLQLMNDKQTHTIPANDEMLNKLSFYLGFSSADQFKAAIDSNRNAVSRIYQSIMGKKVSVRKRSDISEVNFEDKKKAVQDFTFLREGKGLLGHKEFDERTISIFQQIEPNLIEYLKNAINPDAALRNLVRIIKHSTIPYIWYKELSDKKFLNSLLAICEYSQKSVDLFAEDDVLIEMLLTRQVFEKVNTKQLNSYSLKSLIFLLSVQFTLALIDYEKVSRVLSNYYKEVIKEIFTNVLEVKFPSLNYFAAALGSFGSGEMTFNSDVDLIFVLANPGEIPEAEKEFQNILSLIRKSLSPVEVDCRLRPEGKSSILVWDIKTYGQYIEKRLRVWELQAFTKISQVCGSKILFRNFLKLLNKKLQSANDSQITDESREMRKKLYPANLGMKASSINLKKSPGGLLDIEFTAQFIALLSRENFSKIAGKSSKDILKLSPAMITKSDSVTMLRNYFFLKNLDLLNQIMFNTSTYLLPTDKKRLTMLMRRMDFKELDLFHKTLNEIIKTNKSIFQKYLAKK